MYLKELTINGFKSFAKKGELEFSTPITAIVGPNGSGKSNVAESFRFVLGEQSPSRMRGKKGEDLIWNGSSNTSRANRASVSIVLNNEDKVFPLDFDELTVERVVHRDGSNEYFINGSRTRLRDVHELFAAANIGPSGHHIISQGEADRILSSGARERREMIEDALGLKVFQYKKQESEKKLVKTRENIAQVESLRREVKPHLKFLERQVKKIERSIALREELTVSYAEYLYREDAYLAHQYDVLQKELGEPESRLKVLASELEQVNAKLHAAERDERGDALVTLEKDVDGVRVEHQEVVRAIGQLEGKISFLEGRITDQKERQKTVDESPIPYRSVVEATKTVEESLERAEGESDVYVLRRILRDVFELLRGLQNRAPEHTDLGTERDEEELATLQGEQRALEETLGRIESKEKELEVSGEQLRASIEAEHSASREAEREVFRLMNERRELEATLARVAASLKNVEREREEWKGELHEAVALIGSAASQYQKHTVLDAQGAVLRREVIAGESREEQRVRRRELEKMKIRLEELGEGAAEDILKEYNDVKERDEFLMHEVEDLTASIEKLETLIADLNERLNEQFVSGVEKINTEFNTFFTLMFGGGEAKLVRVKPKVRKQRGDEDEIQMEDDEEVVEEGIEIDVKLPNKRVRGLDMLSGGERALTSIALIFAMSQVNPPLFVILDETDAALDEANSRRYGDMITSLAKRSQLILITHNRETMSRAGVLYGVTMGNDGMSRLLSVKFEEAVAVAK